MLWIGSSFINIIYNKSKGVILIILRIIDFKLNVNNSLLANLVIYKKIIISPPIIIRNRIKDLQELIIKFIFMEIIIVKKINSNVIVIGLNL